MPDVPCDFVEQDELEEHGGWPMEEVLPPLPYGAEAGPQGRRLVVGTGTQRAKANHLRRGATPRTLDNQQARWRR